jgi:hypothetical protein
MWLRPALIDTPLWDKDLEGRIERYRGSRIFYEANRKKLEHEAAEAKKRWCAAGDSGRSHSSGRDCTESQARYLVTNHPVQHRMVKILPDTLLDTAGHQGILVYEDVFSLYWIWTCSEGAFCSGRGHEECAVSHPQRSD